MTTIDWEQKVRDLRRMVSEMEMLAQLLEGRNRMLLGRSADELKLFARDIEQALGLETPAQEQQMSLPDWLNTEVYPSSDAQESPEESDEDDFYDHP